MNTKIRKYKNMFLYRLGLVLGFLLVFGKTYAVIKIAVITDTHVMAPELLINDGTAWQKYLASDRKLIDYSRPLLDAVLSKIENEIRPDAVLVTGDLTKDGEVLSHQYI